MLEKKSINKENWKRIIKRKQTSCYIIENNENIGIANLMKIEKVKSRLVKYYDEVGNLKIVDDGYYWLQVALNNKNYWITAMYNEKKEFVQYYIDISYKNVIISKDEAYFYDLFLDVVYCKNNIILLDKNELDQALQLNLISKEQYNMAINVAKDILNNFASRKEELDEFCFKYFKKMELEMR